MFLMMALFQKHLTAAVYWKMVMVIQIVLSKVLWILRLSQTLILATML